MLGQWWIVLSMVIVWGNAIEIQCPENVCSCHSSHSGVTEINCPTDNGSGFIVKANPHDEIEIQCHNSPRWSDFRLSNLFPTHNLTNMYFRMCNLPTNVSLGEITSKLGVADVERLIFQSYGNLTTSLTRMHLKGFPNLQGLNLSSNNLTILPDDLFEDLPHLSSLELRENNVRLSPRIFQNVPNLEVLELGNNKMETIEPAVFDSLSNLRFLNLWQNKFVNIKRGIFDKLVSLKSLDLNTNKLTTLPGDVFEKLENLSVLNLFGNNFTVLPEGLLQRNTKLKIVKIYNNKRNMTTLPRGLFANLTELNEVQLQGDGLITLPEDIFWGSVSLNNINLERNYLVSLPKDIFAGLNNLKTLKLNFNELTSLPDYIFLDTSKLEMLDLSKNHLTSISRHLFSSLKSLKSLYMQQNRLQVIEDKSFNSLFNLLVADFSKNQLTLNNSLIMYHDVFGNNSPFHDCTSLEELYLANNNISEIFGDWIISSVKLRVLDLKYNKIPSISASDLQFVSNDIKVDLSHNNIRHISLLNAENIAVFQNISRDVIIRVNDNPIACDCGLYDFLRYLEGRMHPYVQNYFHISPEGLTCQSPADVANVSVTQLKSTSLKCEVPNPCPRNCTCWQQPDNKAFLVNCSQRNLTSAPRDIENFHDYQLELNLAGNQLTSMLPLANIGLGNTQVSKLILSNNNISDISLDELPLHVESLELDNNNISRINPGVLDFMRNSTTLKKLTLRGNPWVCDCDARDFLNFVQTKVVEIPDSPQITCKDMSTPMLKMTATDFCPADTMMIVGISLAIALTGLIIGTLAALYYRYQEEIKVWLYAHQYCLWFVTEHELDKNKLYDAFISYSHKDEHFVVNELVSKLENGPRPFKLCLHFREWLAGEWITTQVVRSIEDSRRTIVVLSPNFLKSEWGRLEIRTAHRQALTDGRGRVIIILYGEIGPTDILDSELKLYLDTNTYVKWGDPCFWNKLRYALPHPPELTKNMIRRKIFAKHQPSIQINGEKKELIYSVDIPETPLATSTPPADSLNTFICDETDELKKDNSKEAYTLNNGDKHILSPDELANNIINKVQCTTV